MLINELKIYSSKLDNLVAFYADILELNCTQQSNGKASFTIGNSILTIEHRVETTPYHFAITIPSNKEVEALNWLKSRVEILKEEENEIHDFDFWNAKSVYFYDSDMNIVEFISRRNLDNSTEVPFDQGQLLCISEIGLPTTAIKEKFERLNELSGIEQFSGGFERFLAIGDEHGVFICINKTIKDWFPTNDTAYSSDFELDFTNKGSKFHIRYANDRITELVES